ncbi:hypothetical protein BGZ79_010522 [Entomortierella chlamydospora]|nr:hypothetical protein BGZ79_010522 [Entomortierella chlamydospora]
MDQPIYGLQARGLNGKGQLAESVDDMTKDYVDQIRRIQPRGPYQLLGWSFGGSIAHNMAVELEKLGERVDLLALMDTPTEYSRLEEEDEYYSAQADYYEQSGQSGSAESSKGGMALANMQCELRNHLGPVNQSLPSINTDIRGLTFEGSRVAKKHVHRVTKNNTRIAKQYSPAVYTGDMLFFNATVASLESMPTVDPQCWRPFVLGNIEVHKFKFTHMDMATPEPMAEIGRVLNSKLEELHQQ